MNRAQLFASLAGTAVLLAVPGLAAADGERSTLKGNLDSHAVVDARLQDAPQLPAAPAIPAPEVPAAPTAAVPAVTRPAVKVPRTPAPKVPTVAVPRPAVPEAQIEAPPAPVVPGPERDEQPDGRGGIDVTGSGAAGVGISIGG